MLTPHEASAFNRASWGVSLLIVAVAKLFPEQEGSAPQTGETDDSVDDAAEERILTAKEPCNKIKLKDTDQTPVDTADDRQDQSKHIDHVIIPPYKYWLILSFPKILELYFHIDGKTVISYNRFD